MCLSTFEYPGGTLGLGTLKIFKAFFICTPCGAFHLQPYGLFDFLVAGKHSNLARFLSFVFLICRCLDKALKQRENKTKFLSKIIFLLGVAFWYVLMYKMGSEQSFQNDPDTSSHL